MATGIGTNRVVVELTDPLYEALMAEVAARSSDIRKASAAEVMRGLIAEHLVPGGARISSGAK